MRAERRRQAYQERAVATLLLCEQRGSGAEEANDRPEITVALELARGVLDADRGRATTYLDLVATVEQESELDAVGAKLALPDPFSVRRVCPQAARAAPKSSIVGGVVDAESRTRMCPIRAVLCRKLRATSLMVFWTTASLAAPRAGGGADTKNCDVRALIRATSSSEGRLFFPVANGVAMATKSLANRLQTPG